VLHGGDRKTAIASDGVDTADYSIGDRQLAPSHGVTVNISASAATGADKMDGLTPIVVTDDGYGGRDRLFSIEKIKLSSHDDTVRVASDSADLLKTLKEIDGGGQDSAAGDVIDASAYGKAFKLNKGKLEGFDVEFKNFETLKDGAGSTKIEIHGANSTGRTIARLDAGGGDDIVSLDTVGAVIDLGAGNDKLTSAGRSSTVYTGTGNDLIEISHNGQMLVADASATDHFTSYGACITIFPTIPTHTAVTANGTEEITRASSLSWTPQRNVDPNATTCVAVEIDDCCDTYALRHRAVIN
jgi:hypothetical protein